MASEAVSEMLGIPTAELQSVIRVPAARILPPRQVEQSSRNVTPVDYKEMTTLPQDFDWRWTWTFTSQGQYRSVPLDGHADVVRAVPFTIGRVTSEHHGTYQLWARSFSPSGGQIEPELCLSIDLIVTSRRHVHMLADDRPLVLYEENCDRWLWIREPLTQQAWQRFWTQDLRPRIADYRAGLDNNRWDFGAWINTRLLGDDNARQTIAALLGMVKSAVDPRGGWMRINPALPAAESREMDSFSVFAATRRPFINPIDWAILAASSDTLSRYVRFVDSSTGRLRVSKNDRRRGIWVALSQDRGTIAAHEVHVVDSLRSVMFIPREVRLDRQQGVRMWDVAPGTKFSIMTIDVDSRTGTCEPAAFEIEPLQTLDTSSGAVRRWYLVPMRAHYANALSAAQHEVEWTRALAAAMIDGANQQPAVLWQPVSQGETYRQMGAKQLVNPLFGTPNPPAGSFSAMALVCFDEILFSTEIKTLSGLADGKNRWPMSQSATERTIPESEIPAVTAVFSSPLEILSAGRSVAIMDNVEANENLLDIVFPSRPPDTVRFPYVSRMPQRELVSACVIVWNSVENFETRVADDRAREADDTARLSIRAISDAELARLQRLAIDQLSHETVASNLAAQFSRLARVYRTMRRMGRVMATRFKGMNTIGDVTSALKAMSGKELREHVGLYRLVGTQDALFVDPLGKDEAVLPLYTLTHERIFAHDRPDSPLHSDFLHTLIYVFTSAKPVDSPEALIISAGPYLMGVLENISITERSQRSRETDQRKLLVNLISAGIKTTDTLYPALARLGQRIGQEEALFNHMGRIFSALEVGYTMVAENSRIVPVAASSTPGWSRRLSYDVIKQLVTTARKELYGLAGAGVPDSVVLDVNAAMARSLLKTLNEFDDLPVDLFPTHITAQDATNPLPLGTLYDDRSLLVLCEGSGLPFPPPSDLPAFYVLSGVSIGASPSSERSRATTRFAVFSRYQLSQIQPWWSRDTPATGAAPASAAFRKLASFSTVEDPFELADIPTLGCLAANMFSLGIGEPKGRSVFAPGSKFTATAAQFDALMFAIKNPQWARKLVIGTAKDAWDAFSGLKVLQDNHINLLVLNPRLLPWVPPMAYKAWRDSQLLIQGRYIVAEFYRLAQELSALTNVEEIAARVDEMALRLSDVFDRFSVSATATAVSLKEELRTFAHVTLEASMKTAEISRRQQLVLKAVNPSGDEEQLIDFLVKAATEFVFSKSLAAAIAASQPLDMDKLMRLLRENVSTLVKGGAWLTAVAADPDAVYPGWTPRYRWEQPVGTHVQYVYDDKTLRALAEDAIRALLNQPGLLAGIIFQSKLPRVGLVGALPAAVVVEDADDFPVPAWPLPLAEGTLSPLVSTLRKRLEKAASDGGWLYESVSAASSLTATTLQYRAFFIALAMLALDPAKDFSPPNSAFAAILSRVRKQLAEFLDTPPAVIDATITQSLVGAAWFMMLLLSMFRFIVPRAIVGRYVDNINALIYFSATFVDPGWARAETVIRTLRSVGAVIVALGWFLDDARIDEATSRWGERLHERISETIDEMKIPMRTPGAVKSFLDTRLPDIGMVFGQSALDDIRWRPVADAYGKAISAIFTHPVHGLSTAAKKEASPLGSAIRDGSYNSLLKRITDEQTTFTRPNPRETDSLPWSLSTFLGLELDRTRTTTALHVSVYAQRITALNTQISAAPITTASERDAEYVSSILSARERLTLMMRPLSAENMAECAVTMAASHFEEMGTASSKVVPLGLLRKLLWALISDPDFLNFRTSFGLVPYSGADSPFVHMATRWFVDANRFDVVSGMTNRHSYREMTRDASFEIYERLIAAFPETVRMADKFVRQRYVNSFGVNNSRELWRLALFGREGSGDVMLGDPAGRPRYELTLTDWGETLKFVLILDDQIQKAAKRMDAQQAAADLVVTRELAELKADLDASQLQLDTDKRVFQSVVSLATASPTDASIQSAMSEHASRQAAIDSRRADEATIRIRLGTKPSALIDSVDRASLMHAVFSFCLGYLMPPYSLDMIFAQSLHPGNYVVYSQFRGDVVMFIKREIYGLPANWRPVDRAWKEKFKRLANGRLVGPHSKLRDDTLWLLPGGLAENTVPSSEFEHMVFLPVWCASNRVLVRAERSVNPFSRNANALSGTAYCAIDSDLTRQEPGTTGLRKLNVSPLAWLRLTASAGRPEGQDGMFHRSQNDFQPTVEYSFFDWVRGQPYFLRPSIAALNQIPIDQQRFEEALRLTGQPEDDRTLLPKPWSAVLIPQRLADDHSRDLELFPEQNYILDALEKWMIVCDPAVMNHPVRQEIAGLFARMELSSDPPSAAAAAPAVSLLSAESLNNIVVSHVHLPGEVVATVQQSVMRLEQRDAQFADLLRKTIGYTSEAGQLISSANEEIYGKAAAVRLSDIEELIITPQAKAFIAKQPVQDKMSNVSQLAAVSAQDIQRDSVLRYAATHPEFQFNIAVESTRAIERGLAYYREYIAKMVPIVRRELADLKLAATLARPNVAENLVPLFEMDGDARPTQAAEADAEDDEFDMFS